MTEYDTYKNEKSLFDDNEWTQKMYFYRSDPLRTRNSTITTVSVDPLPLASTFFYRFDPSS